MSKDTYNKTGMKFFAVAFVASMVVLGFSVCYNPGPLDQKGGKTVAAGITSEAIVAREKQWRTSSAAAIANGKELYASNCAFCHSEKGSDMVLERFSKRAQRFGAKETELYRTIVRGIPGAKTGEPMIKAPLSFIPAESRWALVHYLRSQTPEPASSSAADWSALDKEAIW